MMLATTVLCGVPVDDVTMADTVDLVASMAMTGRATGRAFQVATVNVDFVVNAVGDPEVLEILQRAALCIPDGMPLVWASRAQRRPLRARVAGADLVPALAERSASTDLSLYFFGSAPGVAECAASLLVDRYPGARIIADGGPAFAAVDEMDTSVANTIRSAAPDVLLVALGNPKQERWIRHWGPHLGVPVLIGVGGSFDFLTGVRRRAPRWMQRSGLEWVARAMQEPARLGPRYARDARVLGPRLVGETRLHRRYRPAGTSHAEVTIADGTLVVRADGALDVWDDPAVRSAWSDLSGISAMRVDLSQLVSLDPVTVTSAVTILRSARRAGIPAGVEGIPDGTDPDVVTLLDRSGDGAQD